MNKRDKWILFVIAAVSFLFGVAAGVLATRIDFRTPPLCDDGRPADKNGCCSGEVYTNMGDLGFNCCPPGDGDCFPPMK